MRIFGFEGTPFPQALDFVFPCTRWIIACTGQEAPQSASVGEPCGRTQYCLPCERLFSELNSMFHAPAVADILVSCLVKCCLTWQYGHSMSSAALRVADVQEHHCGPACPSNPLPGR